jgi:hypothetical protein
MIFIFLHEFILINIASPTSSMVTDAARQHHCGQRKDKQPEDRREQPFRKGVISDIRMTPKHICPFLRNLMAHEYVRELHAYRSSGAIRLTLTENVGSLCAIRQTLQNLVFGGFIKDAERPRT